MTTNETHAEYVARMNKECVALAYLRNAMRAAIKSSESNADKIMVDDGEDKHFYPMNEEGVFAASAWALEIDGAIVIRIHRCTFQVIYDGPYDMDNREEIVCDTNGRASEIIDAL